MWYIVPNMKTRLLTCLFTLLLLEAVASCSRGFSHEGICYAYCGAGVSVQKSETMEHAGNLMIPDTVAHQNERYAVVKIEQDAFKDCKSLRSVVIPHTIKEIGSRAFEGCQGLKAIHCQVAVPLVIDETVFAGVDKRRCMLYVPLLSSIAYSSDPMWGGFIVAEEGEVGPEMMPLPVALQPASPTQDHGE